jgi:flagellar hook-associated protein 3 FlgL
MSVSTIGSQLSNLYMLGLLRQKLNNTQAQVSSGKKGTMLSDLGGSGTSSALGYRNSQSMIESYINNLNTVKVRVSTMDKAMGNVAASARDTLTALRSQLQNGTPLDDITRNDAMENLQSVLAKLNIKVDGRYMFAGSDVGNAPLANDAALKTNVTNAISSLMSGGSFTKDDVVNSLTAITGTDLGFSSTSLAADNITVRSDDGRDLDYTVMAHNSGFRDILRGLTLVANLPKPTTDAETEKYWTLVNGAMDLLDRGAKQVDTAQAVLGGTTKQITTLLADHEDMSLTMDNYIGSVEDIDYADASTRLQQLQAQLQISYQVTASLKDLSLVNFL